MDPAVAKGAVDVAHAAVNRCLPIRKYRWHRNRDCAGVDVMAHTVPSQRAATRRSNWHGSKRRTLH